MNGILNLPVLKILVVGFLIIGLLQLSDTAIAWFDKDYPKSNLTPQAFSSLGVRIELGDGRLCDAGAQVDYFVPAEYGGGSYSGASLSVSTQGNTGYFSSSVNIMEPYYTPDRRLRSDGGWICIDRRFLNETVLTVKYTYNQTIQDVLILAMRDFEDSLNP